MSDQSFKIITTINKVPEDHEALNFLVECSTAPDEDEEPANDNEEIIGRLYGLLVDKGHLPEEFEDWDCDIFDMRSGHAEEAYSILYQQRPLIGKALPASRLLELGSGLALLERVWVKPQYRGKGLALRLMREAQHLLGRYGLLVILKAHPDGEQISPEHLLRLADYYASDKQLGLKHLSKERFPGWLVAHWALQKR